MNRELLEDLHKYFKQKENKNEKEETLLNRLKEELPHFVITYVSRDDLISYGFDVSEVDDDTMTELASKMSEAYQENCFGIDLDILAEDMVEKHRCPKCWKGARRFESYDDTLYCLCGHIWSLTEATGQYVLVEHPDDPSFFSENEIGYDSYNSEDNGAMYVPEHIYILTTGFWP